MPNKNYLRGRRYEWKVRDYYRDRGCVVIRAAGSKSAYDLVVVDKANDHVKFVQCKLLKTGTVKAADALGQPFIKNPPFPESNNYTQELWVRIGKREWIYIV